MLLTCGLVEGKKPGQMIKQKNAKLRNETVGSEQ